MLIFTTSVPKWWGGGGWVIELEGGGQMATPVKNVALQQIALLV